MNKLVEVLMKRNNITEDEAKKKLRKIQFEIQDAEFYENVSIDYIIKRNFDLKTDYVMDILFDD